MIQKLSALLLRLGGWRAEGGPPAVAKYVVIAAPHTSNWDFIWVLAFAGYYGMRIRWIGKHTLFRWPYGWIMRRLGGISVERDRRQSLVKQMADKFADLDALALVVPVEGTRGHVSHWKSGFYHIARTAGVPIAMSYLDYSRKRGGFGPLLVPTGDVPRDMDKLRAFYADKLGKYPHLTSPIRLAEENAPEVAEATPDDAATGKVAPVPSV
jgi:1-acyl-sn-glycerol-3-phosphate acyltransferase